MRRSTIQPMRLGQLARKYEVPVQEIITYLEDTIPNRSSFHPNSKVEQQEITQILDHFNIQQVEELEIVVEEAPENSEKESPEEEIPEQKEEVPTPAASIETPLDDIASVEGEIEPIPMEALVVEEIEEEVEEEEVLIEEVLIEESTPDEPIKVEKPALKDDEVIDTERLLELLESEDESVDLAKITLIKAPKKELSGLKMVGKIDLPEPKKKVEDDAEQESEEDANLNRNKRNQRAQVSEEERENRRLRAKKKKDEFDVREKKRRHQKEAQELKHLRESHYQQKLGRQKTTNQPKRKVQKQSQTQTQTPTQQVTQTVKDQRPQPKTIFGRLWRWMNSID